MDEMGTRAKEPVAAALVGPYGHPFHPLLVTVPIGAWVCSLVFDVASYLTSDPVVWSTGATWLIAIGVVGALLAAGVGFLDFVTIPAGTPAYRTGLVHLSLNLAVVCAYGGNVAWRLASDTGASATAVGPLVLSVLALVALAVGGFLGGKLAFRYGVRVAAEPVQAEGFASRSSARDLPVTGEADGTP